MADATHIVLAGLLLWSTSSADRPQRLVDKPGDLEHARAVIRPLLDAVYANADAFPSYYIRVVYRPTNPEADDAEGRDVGESLTIFEWWRSGELRRFRVTHRSDAPPGKLEEVKETTREDGSIFDSGISRGGRSQYTMDYIGIAQKDLLRFRSGARPGAEHHVFAPGQGDLTYGPEKWDRVAPSPSVPYVLVPGGLSSRSPLRAVEQALETGDFLWNDGVSLLGHRCVLVQVHRARDVTQQFDPSAQPLTYRLHNTYRIYFDACCPGAIRGIDYITRSENRNGSGGVNEHVVRFPLVRRVKDRVWVHWKEVSETRIYRLSDPGREQNFFGVKEVQQCEFRALREDEGALKVSAGTRIYDASDYRRVFVVPEDTVLTLTNFESWVKRVRQELLPAEIALRGLQPGVSRLAPPSERGFAGPLFVGLIFVLVPPFVFVLTRSIRKLRRRRRGLQEQDRAP